MNPHILSNNSLAVLAGASFFAVAADAADLVTNGSFNSVKLHKPVAIPPK